MTLYRDAILHMELWGILAGAALGAVFGLLIEQLDGITRGMLHGGLAGFLIGIPAGIVVAFITQRSQKSNPVHYGLALGAAVAIVTASGTWLIFRAPNTSMSSQIGLVLIASGAGLLMAYASQRFAAYTLSANSERKNAAPRFYRNAIYHMIDYCMWDGAIIGTIIGIPFFVYGGFFGPIFGLVYGSVVGFMVGLSNGLLIGFIAKHYFYPVVNPILFRWTLGICTALLTMGVGGICFSPMGKNGFSSEFHIEGLIIPTVITIGFAVYASQVFATKYLTAKRDSVGSAEG